MTTSQSTQAENQARLHRTIFRLHFYAGLIVAPFVLILSLTGAIYLFGTEIEDLAHPAWRFAPEAGQHLPPERLVQGALQAFPGSKPTRVDLPSAPNRTAIVFLTPQEGRPFRVYVDPVSGKALGSFVYENTLVGFADRMHGTLLLGPNGDLVVEIAACWAIVLIITGLYLWWPRTSNKVSGVFIPRLRKGRLFWREIHAVGGVWASGLLLFLILTGLPWATEWGGNLNRMMANAGIGYPESYRAHVDHSATASAAPQRTLVETTPGIPWTLEQAPAPHSQHAGHMQIDVGQAARSFAEQGLTTGYRLIYPRDEHDVFTGYTYPDRPEGQRTIHLDQYTGAVLNDVSFADYGIGAKSVEWGVQLHMGNYFGVPNQLLMLLAALGGALLSVTGPIMWLKRRRTGLGAPEPLRSGGVVWSVTALLIVLGLLFPALGVTALCLFLIERFVLRRITPVRDWLGLAP
ncbi:PepSY domain-containing protein [Steroidobacter sp. S1-65]|uniref:PepSY domain-containing protein n=1 Tax=Steroidobacter gossypii TaxID=2805490 RepID=A0ABS1WY50_9GAMM|nr:PepSY domain-containing protein [Steroidobacter gossypii]MBM0105904.1 PepSY domain-containing protein [Steroidobacter gossypii]